MPRYNYTDVRVAFSPASRTANTTLDGNIIDRADTNAGVTFAVLAGTVTDGSWAFSVRESDDGTTFTDATATSSEMGASTLVAADDDKVEEIGYKGTKRYVRLRCISTGATTGAVWGAVAILDGGRKPTVKA